MSSEAPSFDNPGGPDENETETLDRLAAAAAADSSGAPAALSLEQALAQLPGMAGVLLNRLNRLHNEGIETTEGFEDSAKFYAPLTRTRLKKFGKLGVTELVGMGLPVQEEPLSSWIATFGVEKAELPPPPPDDDDTPAPPLPPETALKLLQKFPDLNGRQASIAVMMANGLKNEEICEELKIPLHVVHQERGKLYSALGLKKIHKNLKTETAANLVKRVADES